MQEGATGDNMQEGERMERMCKKETRRKEWIECATRSKKEQEGARRSKTGLWWREKFACERQVGHAVHGLIHGR